MYMLRSLVSDAVHFIFGRPPKPARISSALDIPKLQECRALIVDEVDEQLLIDGIDATSPTNYDVFPVRMIKLPVEDISTVAVLSWRWDGEMGCLGSKNVASAVRQSKRMGVQYLFIDAISIDQSLQGDDLVKQVMAFSTLYETVPVIAAYDKADEVYRHTMHRPWITKEARLYRNNPTKIVYVGHTSQGGASFGKYFPKNELQDYRFGMGLDSIWTGSFIETINGVLCGDIGMSYISDLKFIIEPCAQALVVAYEKMSRNDYLLTALILCKNCTDTPKIRLRSNTREHSFDRYKFRKVDGPGSGISWAVYGIFLDGVRVGYLEAVGTTKTRVGSYFAVTPDSEDIVLSSLGFKSSERKAYTANLQARRAYFNIGNESVPLLEIEVVSIELQ